MCRFQHAQVASSWLLQISSPKTHKQLQWNEIQEKETNFVHSLCITTIDIDPVNKCRYSIHVLYAVISHNISFLLHFFVFIYLFCFSFVLRKTKFIKKQWKCIELLWTRINFKNLSFPSILLSSRNQQLKIPNIIMNFFVFVFMYVFVYVFSFLHYFFVFTLHFDNGFLFGFYWSAVLSSFAVMWCVRIGSHEIYVISSFLKLFFFSNIMCFFLSLFVLSPFSTILIMLCNIAPFRAFRRYNIQLVPFYLFLYSFLNRFLYFSNEFNIFCFLFSHFFMMHYQTPNTLVGKQTQNIQFFVSLYLQYF